MCTVQQSIMIELLKSLLAKELITQDTYDKATEAVLNNTEWPNISFGSLFRHSTFSSSGTP